VDEGDGKDQKAVGQDLFNTVEFDHADKEY
jgi:hypothetical protein